MPYRCTTVPALDGGNYVNIKCVHQTHQTVIGKRKLGNCIRAQSVTYIDVTATVMSVPDMSVTGTVTSSFKALEDIRVSLTASQLAGEASADVDCSCSQGSVSPLSPKSAARTKQNVLYILNFKLVGV